MKNTMKKVLVTGGSGGIGRRIVEDLTGCGYHVLFTFNRSVTSVHELVRESPASDMVEPIECDLTRGTAIKNLCERLANDKLHGYVHCAARMTSEWVMTADETSARDLFEINFWSFFSITQAVLPGMRQRKLGRILYISSVASKRPFPKTGVYASTKSAAETLCQSLAVEQARKGITVNSISPGLVNTAMLEGQDLDKISGVIPVGRLGEAMDISRIVRFLMDEDASYVNGANVVVDGGLMAGAVETNY